MLSRDCLRFLLDHENELAEGFETYSNPVDETVCRGLFGRVERAFASRAVRALGREQRVAHSLPESRYIPESVRVRINRDVVGTFARSFSAIGGVKVVVRWSAFDARAAAREADMLFAARAARLVHDLTAPAVHALEINLLLVDAPKTIDAPVLTPECCNSGVATDCEGSARVWVFRSAEWRFVLIHELMHALCAGRIRTSAADQALLRREFRLDQRCDITEAYVDAWATYVHACVVAQRAARGRENYMGLARTLVEYETYHAAALCARVMRIAGTPVQRAGPTARFRETTNALCYYVLRAAILLDRGTLAAWGIPWDGDATGFVERVVRAHRSSRRAIARLDDGRISFDGNRTISNLKTFG